MYRQRTWDKRTFGAFSSLESLKSRVGNSQAWLWNRAGQNSTDSKSDRVQSIPSVQSKLGAAGEGSLERSWGEGARRGGHQGNDRNACDSDHLVV